MKKFIKTILIALALLVPVVVLADVWYPTPVGGTLYLRPNVNAWGISIPQLGTAGNPCLTVNASGVISTQSCAGATTTAITGAGTANYPAVWTNASNLSTTSLYLVPFSFNVGITVNGTTTLASTTNALLLANASGVVGMYAGASNPCSANQVPTTVSATGTLGGCISVNNPSTTIPTVVNNPSTTIPTNNNQLTNGFNFTTLGTSTPLTGLAYFVNGNTISGTSSYVASFNGATGTIIYAPSTTIPVAANPTAIVGSTPVNGSAATFMRSDAAPAFATTTAWTMTGLWTMLGGINFNSTATFNSSTIFAAVKNALLGTDGNGLLIATTSPVTPGSYTNTNLTVDATGRITSAANGTAGSASNTVETATSSFVAFYKLQATSTLVATNTITGTSTFTYTPPANTTSVAGFTLGQASNTACMKMRNASDTGFLWSWFNATQGMVISTATTTYCQL